MQRANKDLWSSLITALVLPIISIMVVPFYDTSEPRYAEIARKMAESNDWITPWFGQNLPFWGKPPLSFWAQALSMKMFGFTEFTARVPSWLCQLLSTAILITGLRPLYGPRTALLSAVIYSTCTLVYICSGAVLTDPFLALGTTLSLVSFAVISQSCAHSPRTDCHRHADHPDRLGKHSLFWWKYGFFIGIVIGVLAKGPLAVVLISMPMFVWYGLNRKSISPAASLPWGRGLAIVMALSLPWYIAAEIRTPGFLNYFIAGEHFRRFLDPGWAGDLYGSAHNRTYGTIWIYWLQASFPWGTVVLATLFGTLVNTRLRSAALAACKTPLFFYWLAGAMVTPLFFTFSANLIWTYVLPSLAGFSVLTAILAGQIHKQLRVSRRVLPAIAGIVPAVVLIFSIVFWMKPDLRKTERELIRYVRQKGELAIPLVYLSGTPFSAQFYSAGKANGIQEVELGNAIKCGKPFYLAAPKEKQSIVEDMMGNPAIPLYSNKRYILLKISPMSRCGSQIITASSEDDQPAAKTLAINEEGSDLVN